MRKKGTRRERERESGGAITRTLASIVTTSLQVCHAQNGRLLFASFSPISLTSFFSCFSALSSSTCPSVLPVRFTSTAIFFSCWFLCRKCASRKNYEGLWSSRTITRITGRQSHDRSSETRTCRPLLAAWQKDGSSANGFSRTACDEHKGLAIVWDGEPEIKAMDDAGRGHPDDICRFAQFLLWRPSCCLARGGPVTFVGSATAILSPGL